MLTLHRPPKRAFEQVSMRLRFLAYERLQEFRRYDAWWALMGYGPQL